MLQKYGSHRAPSFSIAERFWFSYFQYPYYGDIRIFTITARTRRDVTWTNFVEARITLNNELLIWNYSNLEANFETDILLLWNREQLNILFAYIVLSSSPRNTLPRVSLWPPSALSKLVLNITYNYDSPDSICHKGNMQCRKTSKLPRMEHCKAAYPKCNTAWQTVSKHRNN